MFSADNHMAVIIEWIHSSASLNTNPTESFVTAANRGCLSGAAWVQAGGPGLQKASPGTTLHQDGRRQMGEQRSDAKGHIGAQRR